jgi:hypothetical protein
MLSHLVGTSNRADIVRVRELDARLAERDEKISRQEGRLQRLASERDDLAWRVEELEQALRHRLASAAVSEPQGPSMAQVRQRLETEQARAAELATRLAQKSELLAARDRDIQAIEAQAAAFQHELRLLEAVLADITGPAGDEAAEAVPDLAGKRLLYVGGRPRQLDQIRAFVTRQGGALIAHDGGVEESTTLLPGLVSQADIAFFPVDCVSHRAMEQVKRFCRQAGKPMIPLRNASVASFLAALRSIDAGAEVAAP